MIAALYVITAAAESDICNSINWLGITIVLWSNYYNIALNLRDRDNPFAQPVAVLLSCPIAMTPTWIKMISARKDWECSDDADADADNAHVITQMIYSTLLPIDNRYCKKCAFHVSWHSQLATKPWPRIVIARRNKNWCRDLWWTTNAQLKYCAA